MASVRHIVKSIVNSIEETVLENNPSWAERWDDDGAIDVEYANYEVTYEGGRNYRSSSDNMNNILEHSSRRGEKLELRFTVRIGSNCLYQEEVDKAVEETRIEKEKLEKIRAIQERAAAEIAAIPVGE